MLRKVTCVCVVLMAAGLAYGYPGEVVSYSLPVPSSGFYQILSPAQLPSGGFVLTDIALTQQISGWTHVGLRAGEEGDYLAYFTTYSSPNGDFALPMNISYASGVKVPGDTALWMYISSAGASPRYLTITGYIPDPTMGGTVPTVSTWGLIILGVLVLTLGTVFIGKRKVSVA